MNMMRTAVMVAVLVLAVGAADARASCSVSATSTDFGTYDVFSAVPNDSTGMITLTCTKKEKNIRITLDRGRQGSFDRAFHSGTDELHYNLYLNATRSAIWGDGTAGTVDYHGEAGKNDVIRIPVYGRIPAGQDARVGAYRDDVIVTVLY